jgi:hypothetical protein
MSQSMISLLMQADPRIDFLLLRQGRTVIQDGGMREHLIRLPREERTDPVCKVLFLRAGIRITDE